MDKDLRDAYKALSLVHAHLDATKKEKVALEDKLKGITQQQRAHIEELHESFRQREQDLLQQLDDFTAKQQRASAAPDSQQDQKNSASNRPGDQPEKEEPVEGDNQHEDQREIASTAANELILRDNLSLQAQLTAQAEQLIAQEAVFVQSRDEWALQHEALKMQVATTEEQLADVSRDKKFMEEKFEFLHVEVDVVKKERDELAARVKELEAQAIDGKQEEDTSAVELARLDNELQEARAQASEAEKRSRVELKQEQAMWEQEKQKLIDTAQSLDQARVDSVQETDAKAAQVVALQQEVASLTQTMEALQCEREDLAAQLVQRNQIVLQQQRQHAKEEEERMTLQLRERETMQYELTTLLTNFEAMVAGHAVEMGSLQHANESLQASLSAKIDETKALKQQLDKHRRRVDELQTCSSRQRDLLQMCRRDLQEQGDLLARYEQDQLQWIESIKQTVTKTVNENTDKRQAIERERDQLRELLASLTTERDTQAHRLDEYQVESIQLRTANESNQRELACVQQALGDKECLQRQLADQVQALQSTVQDLEHQLSLASAPQSAPSLLPSLENQLMATEDHDGHQYHHHHPVITSPIVSWDQLASVVRQLDDFLPQLQLVAGRLHTSLQLCADNTRAIKLLGSHSLLQELLDLVVFSQRWKTEFDTQQLAPHVRLVRRSVLASLSQWFEESELNVDEEPVRPPPFSIDSKEVAIVLQNWTSDQEKQQRVAAWLQRIVSRHDTGNADPEGDSTMTLELANMTRHVKDAFCVLVVPLLQQNRDAHVRVFTRRVGDVKSSYSPDESCWEMKIHVQFGSLARNQAQRRARLSSAQSSSLRRVSSSSSISSVESVASSVASSLSLASISSASKLQIIHARLQQMQQGHNHS